MKQQNTSEPECRHEHGTVVKAMPPAARFVKAAAFLRAMGDPERLRLLTYLAHGECCVSELVANLGEKFSTVSQRLRILRTECLVTRRRDASHVYYQLADAHVARLVTDALEHANEPISGSSPDDEEKEMAHTHDDHTHQHGPNCGHTAVKHGDHLDYLHDGHLHHHTADGKVEEHTISVSTVNPDECTSGHTCTAHEADHVHGPGCGHEAVPHGDHVDYVVDGHLHHQHAGHCDNHGPVEVMI